MHLKAWNPWRHMPFVARILVIASVALIVAGIALLASIANEETEQAKARLDRALADQMAILPSALSEWIVVGDFAVIQQSLDRFVSQKGVTSITYRSANGAIVTSQDESVTLEAPAWFAAAFGNPHRSGLTGVKVGGRDYGALEIVMTANPAINQAWARLQRHLAILALAVSLGFFGILLVVRNGLRPLTALDEGARALEEGNLAIRIPLQGSPELLHTIRAFNRMAESVEVSQNRLHKSLDRLALAASVFKHATEGITITDAEQRILEVNPAFTQITGYSRAEALGKTPRILASGRYDAAFYEVMWTSIRETGQWRGDIWNRNKSGDLYSEQLSIVAVRDMTGQVTNYIGIFSDTSELARKVAERTRELNEAMAQAEAANRAKGDFLANMSHEIRTPMNAILGLARMGARGNPDSESWEIFRRIQDSGDYLLRIINDILDLSKIEAGMMTIDARRFRVRDVIASVRSHIAGLAEQKGLDFRVDLDANLPEYLVADAQRIQQILTNLLANAVKFTERGHVSLAITLAKGYAIFRIADTGIGMTAEQMKRLFIPFEQGDMSITRNYGGTGLGLAISSRFANLMHGDIGVESESGRGSTFTVTLPMVESATQFEEAPTPATDSGNISGCRVLAAEDIEVNRFVLEDILTDAGASVVFAENGSIAVSQVEERPNAFDVVLMDVMMPVMDGYEAAKRIHALAPTLPVIGLTAYALAEDRDRCLAAGMSHHVTKPIDPSVLIQAIRHAMGSSDTASRNSLPATPSAPEQASDGCPPNAAATQADGDLVDWSYLEERVGAKPGRLDRMVKSALAEQREKPGRLRAAAAESNAAEIRTIAHGLRSVAGNLRAQRLVAEAAEVESIARDDQTGVRVVAEHLAATTDRFLEELSNWLGKRDCGIE
jgi:PAS domain S-box-containing protein